MKSARYQIGWQSLFVDQRFAITLASNGKKADAACWLIAAPAIDGGIGCIGIYIATNGNPVAVASLDHKGEVVWYLGEDDVEETEAVTIAVCLEGFPEFAGRSAYDCAEHCADLFGAVIERGR